MKRPTEVTHLGGTQSNQSCPERGASTRMETRCRPLLSFVLTPALGHGEHHAPLAPGQGQNQTLRRLVARETGPERNQTRALIYFTRPKKGNQRCSSKAKLNACRDCFPHTKESVCALLEVRNACAEIHGYPDTDHVHETTILARQVCLTRSRSLTGWLILLFDGAWPAFS